VTAAGEIVLRHKYALAAVSSEGRVAILDLDDLAEPPRILEGTAAAIWSAVDGARTTSLLVAAVAEEFGLTAAEVRTDVVEFLEYLADLGLLVAAP
jgi:hypothetical protein